MLIRPSDIPLACPALTIASGQFRVLLNKITEHALRVHHSFHDRHGAHPRTSVTRFDGSQFLLSLLMRTLQRRQLLADNGQVIRSAYR
jgi:hypothetical protein